MPLHDLQCSSDACDYTMANVYIPLDKIDAWSEPCVHCNEPLEFDFRVKVSRNTRSHKFKEFTLYHTRRLDGAREPRKINSLHDIRQFEKEHEDQQVCVEAFSYDSQQHIPEPKSQDDPVTMTDDQKRDFMEKYRDMNIKDERSARDY